VKFEDDKNIGTTKVFSANLFKAKLQS